MQKLIRFKLSFLMFQKYYGLVGYEWNCLLVVKQFVKKLICHKQILLSLKVLNKRRNVCVICAVTSKS